MDVCLKVAAKVDRKEDGVCCNDFEARLEGRNQNGEDLVGQEAKHFGMYSDWQLASLRRLW